PKFQLMPPNSIPLPIPRAMEMTTIRSRFNWLGAISAYKVPPLRSSLIMPSYVLSTSFITSAYGGNFGFLAAGFSSLDEELLAADEAPNSPAAASLDSFASLPSFESEPAFGVGLSSGFESAARAGVAMKNIAAAMAISIGNKARLAAR